MNVELIDSILFYFHQKEVWRNLIIHSSDQFFSANSVSVPQKSNLSCIVPFSSSWSSWAVFDSYKNIFLFVYLLHIKGRPSVGCKRSWCCGTKLTQPRWIALARLRNFEKWLAATKALDVHLCRYTLDLDTFASNYFFI